MFNAFPLYNLCWTLCSTPNFCFKNSSTWLIYNKLRCKKKWMASLTFLSSEDVNIDFHSSLHQFATFYLLLRTYEQQFVVYFSFFFIPHDIEFFRSCCNIKYLLLRWHECFYTIFFFRKKSSICFFIDMQGNLSQVEVFFA